MTECSTGGSSHTASAQVCVKSRPRLGQPETVFPLEQWGAPGEMGRQPEKASGRDTVVKGVLLQWVSFIQIQL